MNSQILIADDQRLLREGLKSLLQQEGFPVIAEAEDGRTAVKLAMKLKPAIVLTGIRIPGLNGIEIIRQLQRDCLGSKVIVLSAHCESRFVLGAFAAGAWGYMVKESGFEEMIVGLKAVLAGRKYISPAVADVLVQRAVAHWLSESECQYPKISTREREVLQLVAEGKSTKEIAASLYVSVKTVETHRKQIMDRLNLPSVAGLTKYAIRQGIISA